MAVTHNLVTLNNSTATAVSVTGQHAGRDITVQNISDTANVYLGGDEVSTSNYGYKILPGSAWSVELRSGEVLYAVSSASSSQVAVIQLGLESENT
jgi:hypothetical protein